MISQCISLQLGLACGSRYGVGSFPNNYCIGVVQGNIYNHMDSHLVKKSSEGPRGKERGRAGRMAVGSSMRRALELGG